MPITHILHHRRRRQRQRQRRGRFCDAKYKNSFQLWMDLHAITSRPTLHSRLSTSHQHKKNGNKKVVPLNWLNYSENTKHLPSCRVRVCARVVRERTVGDLFHFTLHKQRVECHGCDDAHLNEFYNFYLCLLSHLMRRCRRRHSDGSWHHRHCHRHTATAIRIRSNSAPDARTRTRKS